MLVCIFARFCVFFTFAFPAPRGCAHVHLWLIVFERLSAYLRIFAAFFLASAFPAPRGCAHVHLCLFVFWTLVCTCARFFCRVFPHLRFSRATWLCAHFNLWLIVFERLSAYLPRFFLTSSFPAPRGCAHTCIFVYSFLNFFCIFAHFCRVFSHLRAFPRATCSVQQQAGEGIPGERRTARPARPVPEHRGRDGLADEEWVFYAYFQGFWVFGLPGSGSVIICMDPIRILPSSNKNIKKNLDFCCFVASRGLYFGRKRIFIPPPLGNLYFFPKKTAWFSRNIAADKIA